MANKRKTTKRFLPPNNNPYISWSAGDAALKEAISHPLPSKDVINSNESEKMLRDILR